MIVWLLVNLPLFISYIFKLPQILIVGTKRFIKRVKEHYWSKPHWSETIYVHGRFGAGKGIYTVDKIRNIIKRYPKCNLRILTNMTLNEEELKKLGFPIENYRFFSNVDDVQFLLETKIDEKTGEEVPAFDAGLLVLDELSAVLSNRSFMNSKKGKGIITQDFLSLLYQVRKFNTLTILQSQTPAFDITFRRLITDIHCPHMKFFNAFNQVNVYKPEGFFAYLDDTTLPVPEPIRKFIFIVKDEVFRTYNTRQLVKGIVEGDYFRAGDKDLPLTVAGAGGNTVVSHSQHKKSLSQKLLGNKTL